MSSGSHAGFMGEQEGAPALGTPGTGMDACGWISKVQPLPIGGFGHLRLQQEKGRGGKGGSGLWGSPGVHSVGTDVPKRLLVASGLPRAILESNCLLILSGCN